MASSYREERRVEAMASYEIIATNATAEFLAALSTARAIYEVAIERADEEWACAYNAARFTFQSKYEPAARELYLSGGSLPLTKEPE